MAPNNARYFLLLLITAALPHTAPGTEPVLLESAPLAVPRAGHRAVLMADGRVLMTGGCAAALCDQVQRSTEFYIPAQTRFAAGVRMHEARVSHTATRLLDGRVWVAGGWTGKSATTSTEWFDPRSGRWQAGPRLTVARMDGTATRLDNGQVLLAGGAPRTAQPTAMTERFDPESGRILATEPLRVPRVHHAAVKLSDGRVLVVGGLTGRGQATASAEIYDPRTGRFEATGSLSRPRAKLAALRLADGRVMVLAGSPDGEEENRLASTEIYDPATGTFGPGPHLLHPRYKIAGAAVRLRGGHVLIAGGSDDVELWSPGDPAFRKIDGGLGATRAFSTATVLGNGQVLVAGGYDDEIRPTTLAWRVAVESK